jgi:hypothetical protein
MALIAIFLVAVLAGPTMAGGSQSSKNKTTASQKKAVSSKVIVKTVYVEVKDPAPPEPPPPPADPLPVLDRYAKVAIVPTIDLTGGNYDFGQKLVKSANDELNKEFTSHNLTIVDDKVVAAAIKRLGIDFSDEENQTKANVEKVGQLVGADLVVFDVITDSSQQQHSNFWDNTKEGKCTERLWCMNVRSGVAYQKLSGNRFQGSSKHHDFGGIGIGGSDYQITAAANCVRDAFNDFFKYYGPH